MGISNTQRQGHFAITAIYRLEEQQIVDLTIDIQPSEQLNRIGPHLQTWQLGISLERHMYTLLSNIDIVNY